MVIVVINIVVVVLSPFIFGLVMPDVVVVVINVVVV